MGLIKVELIKEYQDVDWSEKSQLLLDDPLLQKDIWHTVNDLNLRINEHKKSLTLNFSYVTQNWFKLLIKLYILVRAKPGASANTISTYLFYIKQFSVFLDKFSICSPNQLNSQVFELFDCHLQSLKVNNPNTIRLYYIVISNFFDTCRLEGWLNVDTYWFRGRCQRFYPNNDEIEYLPENIWNQLNENLHYLPESLQRMVLVIRTTGLRVGELCNMPFDCLRKRGGNWRIRFRTEKYDTEDELPLVVPELVAVIKEQQNYIRKELGKEYDKLFCANRPGQRICEKGCSVMSFKPNPKVMLAESFNVWLNKLAMKYNIRSKNGDIWHFQSHQFRRTVATVMANAGIRDLIIQKYLRHRSSSMQNYYVHFLKQVLGDEVEKIMNEKKYVNVRGKIVDSYKPKDIIYELVRQKMHQITTQYGECHRPNLKITCPTINACLRCEHWRVSTNDLVYLKDDLMRVEEELEIAIQLSMVRQQKGLEVDRNNLFICIKTLEKNND